MTFPVAAATTARSALTLPSATSVTPGFRSRTIWTNVATAASRALSGIGWICGMLSLIRRPGASGTRATAVTRACQLRQPRKSSPQRRAGTYGRGRDCVPVTESAGAE